MKANRASEPRCALKFRFKFQIKTARMSCVLSFVARRKISPTGASRADVSFDDTGSDGASYADAIFDDASFDDVKKRGRVGRVAFTQNSALNFISICRGRLARCDEVGILL